MAAWRYIRDESLAIPLLAPILLTVLLVSPRGDFPMNDDWIYAQTVAEILETGVYRGHHYADPLFLVHAYWGALVTSIFGFSFTALRCSTLLMFWLAGWMAAKSAREVDAQRPVALLIGLLIIANPIALNLGYTFMTDVPFLALAHTSLYLFLRHIRTGSVPILLAASALAAVAYFVRQFGLLIPVAFVAAQIALILKKGVSFNPRTAAALLAPWLTAFIVVSLLPESARGISPEFDVSRLGSGVISPLLFVVQHVLRCLAYVAMFSAPLLVLAARGPAKFSARGTAGCLAIVALGYWLLLRGRGSTLPYFGNVLYDLGVGSLTLRGIVQNGELANPLKLGELWWIPTVVFGVAAVWLLWRGSANGIRAVFVSQKDENEASSSEAKLFLTAIAAAYILVLVIPGVAVIYDRYLLMPLLPVALLVMHAAPEVSTKRMWVSGAVLSCMGLFSIVALQDYMAWQRARWDASLHLTNSYPMRGRPEHIDGGYEYQGLTTSKLFIDDDVKDKVVREYGSKGGWVLDDHFAISFVERENFEVIETVPYYSWLGFEEREILILKRVREDEF